MMPEAVAMELDSKTAPVQQGADTDGLLDKT